MFSLFLEGKSIALNVGPHVVLSNTTNICVTMMLLCFMCCVNIKVFVTKLLLKVCVSRPF